MQFALAALAEQTCGGIEMMQFSDASENENENS